MEFGAKLAISLVDGFAHMEKLAWDNFNKCMTLQWSVEAYRERFGYDPEAVLADKIYRNRENIQYCKSLGIRLSGPALGRPKNTRAFHKCTLLKVNIGEPSENCNLSLWSVFL